MARPSTLIAMSNANKQAMKIENAVYHCDNLMLPERLPSESVKLAHCDPPWNTHSS
jgi:hypothetical protein